MNNTTRTTVKYRFFEGGANMETSDLEIRRGAVRVLWAITPGGLHTIIKQSPRGAEIRTTGNEILANRIFKKYLGA